MTLGFTGTREGMSQKQKDQFCKLVIALNPHSLRHGDCVGADDEAANLIHELNSTGKIRRCTIIGHPPLDQSHRAFSAHTDIWLPPKGYLERNRDIVRLSNELIAAPLTNTRQKRGGTWYTICYAIDNAEYTPMMLER